MYRRNYENIDEAMQVLFEDVKRIDMEVYDEAGKLKFADRVVTKIMNDICKKISGKDYKVVERTKGDFTKLGNYKELGKAINYIKAEAKQKHSAELQRRADVLEGTYKMLASHKDTFTAGFEFGNDALIVVYNSVATSLISAVSSTISMTVRMSDDYKWGTKEYKSSTITALQEINKLAASGKIRRMGDNLVARREEVKTTLAVGVVAVVIYVLKNIKTLVFNYYSSRVKMADHLRNISEFVAAKSDRTMNTSLKKKQDKWIEVLSDLADKIDIDTRKAEAEAQKSIVSSDAAMADIPTDFLF